MTLLFLQGDTVPGNSATQILDAPLGLPDATAMSHALQSRTVTSEALIDACLERIARHDTVLHAFITVYGTDAREAAREADRRIGQGQSRGPLDGIPVAIKDAFDLAGTPTGFGSMGFAGNIATRSCAAVERLQAAGAIVLGKTHQVAFALGAWGTNDEMGTPRNPWDMQTHRVPGGSSSGSAVAVAAGLVPLALGTDTGGSIRVPASFCGITGFKPCIDAIARSGVKPLSQTLDSVGLFSRSVNDAALLFQALRQDAARPPEPVAVRNDLRGLTLGRLPSALIDVAPAVQAAYDASLDCLRDLGATLTPLQLPASFVALADVANTIMLYEGAALYAPQATDPAWVMDASVRDRFLAGTRISRDDYQDALALRRLWQDTFAAATMHLDAWLTPTTPDVAVPLDKVDYGKPPVPYTRVLNLLDLCGISIPNGVDAAGMPTGLQIAGRADQTDSVLTIAQLLESRSDWHRRTPLLPIPENRS